MRKIIALLIILIILSVGILSGCEQQSNTNTIAKDTDGDGYPDTQDAFPTDSNLHLITPFETTVRGQINRDIGVNLPPHGDDGGTIQVSDTIESDYKYVECKWSIQPDNASIREYFTFEISNPAGYNKYTGNQLSGVQNYRQTISLTNSGNWMFSFTYRGGVSGTPSYLPDYITLTYEIYKVK